MDVIISMNVTTKKFFFIQLIILNLLNVLKDHQLTTANSKFILLFSLFNFVNLFCFLITTSQYAQFFSQLKRVSNLSQLSYRSSHNLTPPISRVLIARHLIFGSLTLLTCCKSPQKCTPVKHKARQKAGFPTVTQTTSSTRVVTAFSNFQ